MKTQTAPMLILKQPQKIQQTRLWRLHRAAGLARFYLTAQWARAADAKAAQASFIKINQSGTPIEPTELRIINARKSANALAARAITRAGTGHKYWSRFGDQTKEKIQVLGRDIYSALYHPPLQEGPVSTLDLPIAGSGYNVLPFVFDPRKPNKQSKAAGPKEKD